MNSLKPKFLYQLSTSFLYAIAPLLVFPYISRVLGPENIGKINFIDFTAQFLLLFASFGIPLYGVREVAKLRNNKPALNKLITELFCIHVVATFISVGIFAFIIAINNNIYNETGLVVLAGINLLISAFSFEWFIHGLEDFAFLSKRSFIIKIASVILIFLLIKTFQDYVQYYFILIAGNAFLLLVDILYIFKKRIHFVKDIHPGRHLKSLMLFFLTSTAVSLYTFFDTIMLGIISGSLAVGFYTTGLKVVKLSQTFVNDLSGVLLPRMAFLIETDDQFEINRIINKSLQYAFTISIPLSIFFFLLAPEIIIVLASQQFAPSIDVLRILCVLPLIVGLSNVFGIQVLLPFGKEKKVLIAVVAGCVSSLCLNYILCPVYAQKGAAISCIIAELIVTFLMFLYAVKLFNFIFPLKLILGIIFSSLFFIPVVYLSRNFSDSVFIVFLASSFLCLVVYVFMQVFVFSNSIMKEVINFISSKIFNYSFSK
ncbi:MAG: flippase [Bacteroidota bacterium]|nr:flippase [Bacteroidota bacterium]